MLTCSVCQSQMLDHLFGLLDDETERLFQSHIISCSECATTLRKEREVHGLICRAAKQNFPEVKFNAPANEPQPTPKPNVPVTPIATEKARPKTQPSPKGVSGSGSWVKWLVAASLLIGGVALGIPAYMHYSGWKERAAQVNALEALVKQNLSEQQRLLAENKTKQDEVDKAFAEASQKHQEVNEEWRKAFAEARQALEQKSLHVRVTGPERPQPGGVNEWRIETLNRNNTYAKAKIEVLFRDGLNNVVHRQVFDQPTVPPTVRFPVEKWSDIKGESELYLDVVSFDDNSGESKLCEKLSLAKPVYVTQLVTDKPMYQLGQTVYFRSLTLDRASFQPPTKEMQLEFKLTKPDGSTTTIDKGSTKLLKSDGSPVLGPDGKPITGIGTGSFLLDKAFPGGEYTLVVFDALKNAELAKRKFLVNSEIVLDKFMKKLEFDGKSYGANDLVQLRAEATRAEGPLSRVPVDVQVVVDGQPQKVSAASTTNEKGEYFLSFRLPKTITRGDGSVTITFRDKDTTESIVRPIPLVGKQLKLEFYPEGGDLVQGIPSRVYFQVRLPSGKPADIKGYLTDGTEKITDIVTLTDVDEAGVSRGQGVFSFTPKAGKDYYLKLTQPTSIDEPKHGNLTGFQLPKAKPEGVVLTIKDGVVGADDPLKVELQASNKRSLLVGAYARGRLVDHERITLEANKSATVTLKPDRAIGGVTRVTVFEETTEKNQVVVKPVAERLVYRKFEKQLLCNIQPDQNRYNPGSKVNLNITALNDKEQPTPAVMMVAVINQSVVTMADLKTDRLMPSHFLIGTEVEKPEDLEHADFLLSDHPKATAVLDLLLGTQGWRRFVEQSPETFQAKTQRADVDRLLVSLGQKSSTPRSVELELVESLTAKYEPKVEKAFSELLTAAKTHEAFHAGGGELQEKLNTVNTAIQSSRSDLNTALNRLEEYESGRESSMAWAVPLLCASLLIGAMVFLINGLNARQKKTSAVPQFAFGGVMLALGLVAMVGLIGMQHPQLQERTQMAMGKAQMPNEGMALNDFFLEREMVRDNRAEMPDMLRPQVEAGMAPGMGGFGGFGGGMANPQAKGFPRGGGAGFGGGFIGGGMGGPPGFPLPARPGGLPQPLAMDMEMPKMAPANRLDEKKGEARELAMKEVAPPVPAKAKNEPVPTKLAGEGARNKGTGGDLGGGKPAANEEQLRKQMEALKQEQQADKREAGEGREFKKDAMREAEKLADEKRQLEGKGANGDKAIQDFRAELLMRQRLANGMPNRDRNFRGPMGGPIMGGPQVGGFGAPMEMPFGGLGGRGEMKGIQLDALMELEKELAPDTMPLFVREYAHVHQPSADGLRNDFAETVCWMPVLVLPKEGTAKVSFDLSDDIAKYQVIVAGHTLQGNIGASKLTIEARKPFSLDPKLPSEITSSDRIDLAVRGVNDSNEKRVVTYTVQPSGFVFDKSNANLIQEGFLRDRLELPADGKGRKVYSIRSNVRDGRASIRLDGSSEPMAPRDFIERDIKVVPDGFPLVGAYSDLLEGNSSRTIQLPKDLIPGSLKVSLNLYPTTLADLQNGLEGLLREPNGCFEQTSTSNYPNTLILDYLETSDQANPQASKRARDLLQRGYQKLTSFECQTPNGQGRQGYEWFGGTAPPHEALTAYGLLQFRDMARVYPVDQEMLKRTQQYLMTAKNDTTGGFNRNARALDSFGGAPEHITNAYIVWALTESDPDDKLEMKLEPQFARLKREAEEADKKNDSYFLALIANALLNRGTQENRDLAVKYLERIVAQQDASGYFNGAQTSITRSGGRDLQIETTAISVLAFLKANRAEKFQGAVQKAAKWIGQQRGGYGGFGSTQSTIMALKSLIAFTKANAHPAEDGTITLTVKGKATKTFKKEFTKADREVVTLVLDNPEEIFQPGENELSVEITKTAKPYPFSVAWVCTTTTPISSPETQVQLSTKLDREVASEGETVRLDVSLKNLSEKDTGMATTILGLPAGTIIPRDMKQLTKLREDGKISYFELRGREVILYWRAMQPKQQIDLSLDLICDVPGEYRGPASRAYLYYNADHKHWLDPLKIRITPAQ